MSAGGIDWSRLRYPGPTRVFTPAEIARAGGEPPSRTLIVVVMLNLAVLAEALLQAAPPQATAVLAQLPRAARAVARNSGRLEFAQPYRRQRLHGAHSLAGPEPCTRLTP